MIARLTGQVCRLAKFKADFSNRNIPPIFASASQKLSLFRPTYEEIDQRIHPDDRRLNGGVKDVLRDMLRDGLRLRESGATFRWFRCSAVPIQKPDGSVQEWIGISVDVHNEKRFDLSAPPSKLTGAQMRAARGILNWSVKQFAKQSRVSPAVVRRLEEYDGALPVSDELIELFQKTLSDAGIELLFPPVGKPGVRPR
ncbi:PAS domain-containing protein [Bradyrhizobium sp. LTSP885]|uniref:PAS domain-containing protein n=1 Tax=Bradyrhizobium sp. LTSP885 TaxID=1619232 RepID=UPI00069BD4FA|nr:PAS domain-containing protein [Bradyrhizobium sp. LTSP885]